MTLLIHIDHTLPEGASRETLTDRGPVLSVSPSFPLETLAEEVVLVEADGTPLARMRDGRLIHPTYLVDWGSDVLWCVLCCRAFPRDTLAEHIHAHRADPLPQRESRYIDEYLDGPPYTVGTFLAYRLRGTARRWADVYARALQRALWRREARGEVVAVRSLGGRTAYRRREESLARAHDGAARLRHPGR